MPTLLDDGSSQCQGWDKSCLKKGYVSRVGTEVQGAVEATEENLPL